MTTRSDRGSGTTSVAAARIRGFSAAVQRAGVVRAEEFDGRSDVDAEAQPVALDRRPKAPWDMTPTAERDWFEVLPDGLIVVLEPDRPAAGRRRRGRGSTSAATGS